MVFVKSRHQEKIYLEKNADVYQKYAVCMKKKNGMKMYICKKKNRVLKLCLMYTKNSGKNIYTINVDLCLKKPKES